MPKIFILSTQSGASVWVHANATKHIAEFLKMKAINSTSEKVKLATQIQLRSLQASINMVIKDGIIFEHIIKVGDWKLKFGMPTKIQQLPVLFHARLIP